MDFFPPVTPTTSDGTQTSQASRRMLKGRKGQLTAAKGPMQPTGFSEAQEHSLNDSRRGGDISCDISHSRVITSLAIVKCSWCPFMPFIPTPSQLQVGVGSRDQTEML